MTTEVYCTECGRRDTVGASTRDWPECCRKPMTRAYTGEASGTHFTDTTRDLQYAFRGVRGIADRSLNAEYPFSVVKFLKAKRAKITFGGIPRG